MPVPQVQSSSLERMLRPIALYLAQASVGGGAGARSIGHVPGEVTQSLASPGGLGEGIRLVSKGKRRRPTLRVGCIARSIGVQGIRVACPRLPQRALVRYEAG